MLAARGRGELERVAGEIKEAAGTTETLALDVADVGRAAEALVALGPVDILVNNAGGNRPAPLLDVTVEDFDAVMGINVRGAYFCAQAVAREMVAAKRRCHHQHVLPDGPCRAGRGARSTAPPSTPSRA